MSALFASSSWLNVARRLQCKTDSMVGLQVIDLLPEQNRPQVLAEEFDNVEIVGESRAVSREPAQAQVSASEDHRDMRSKQAG